MVGDPSLCEGVKLVELRLGVDALNGLLKIEPFCVWPDQFALLGVELRLLQQVPEDVADLDGFLALWRVHPLKESIEERVIREDTVLRLFPALLAHEVLKQV